jgi:hypothetical protein
VSNFIMCWFLSDVIRSKWMECADREQVNEYKFLSGNLKGRRSLMRSLEVNRGQY